MTQFTPQERAQRELFALDQVDRAIDQVYALLNAKERRRIALDELMHCEGLEPEFEYRLQVNYKLRQEFPEAHLPQCYWFYSIKGLVNHELVMGALIGGDLMIIQAATREGADKLAAEGLKQTLEIAKDLKYNALLLPDVIEDPAASIELVADGRRAGRGAPMRGDMAEKIHRMMADRMKPRPTPFRRPR